MGSLIGMPLIGILGIFFIIYNIIIFILFLLTLIFGIIRIVKRKFVKTFLILLTITIVFVFIDYNLIRQYVYYDQMEQQRLVKKEGKELVAIRNNEYEKLEEYLKNGWNPNETTKAVYYAIKYNSEENKNHDQWDMLELLLQYHANSDVQIYENPSGVNTPLTYTTECGYYGATKILLEYGANPNYQESYMNQNALLSFRFYENRQAAKTLQLLLDYNIDLEARQSLGNEVNRSGREKLQSFEKDYHLVREDVPDYEAIIKIIDSIKP